MLLTYKDIVRATKCIPKPMKVFGFKNAKPASSIIEFNTVRKQTTKSNS